MSILDALLYSVMGICVVFFALILLMGIIKLLLKVSDLKLKKEKEKALAPLQASCSERAHASAGDLALYDTNPRDAAMCMAIIADQLGKPLEELRFISIREIREEV